MRRAAVRAWVRAAVRPATTVFAHDHGHRSDAERPGGRAGAELTRRVPPPLVALGREVAPPDPAVVGRKAVSLRWLAGHGAAVPAAVAIPADVAERIGVRETLAEELLAGALRRWADPDHRYAVRSSADVEDGLVHSLAGQLDTRLDVDADDLLEAVRAVAAPDHARLDAYLAATGAAAPKRIAVVVQVMVEAVAAGVAFSRNPMTGLDEVVVEAVPGRGDALVGEGVTPDRWVRRWGAFTEEPTAPRVETAIVARVASETRRLAAAFGGPVDLEWAHDGHALWWLQARPMTGLEGLRVYSNRIAREVLPGVIKPLVWSVNVPIVNAAWIDLLEELVGPLDVRPEKLARPFAYRAYFDMTTLGDVFAVLGMPRESLELLLGLPRGPEAPRFAPTAATMRHLPRMGSVALRSLHRGRWARLEVDSLRRAYAQVAAVDPGTLDEMALIGRADLLTTITRRAAYANIVIPLLMLGYGKALERTLDTAGVDPRGTDPSADRADRRRWDPSVDLTALRSMADALPGALRADLEERGVTALDDREEIAKLRDAVGRFLKRFGHLSASGNDLSVAPWREDPDQVVGLLLAHPDREIEGPRMTLAEVERRLPAFGRPFLRLLWRRAGAFRVYREAVSSTYTGGYGLFRGTFLALGSRFVARGIIATHDDVLYLTLEEVRALATGAPLPPDDGAEAGRETGATASDASERAARRRVEVEAAADLIVPDLVFGDAFVARRADEVVRDSLHGIPTSRGVARGTARIVRGAADFVRVETGDVVVIPHSDVAWTPVFARAAAVVAEAGGMLSHSSIVAREYAIPCVVSVTGACSLIPDGAPVVVDGLSGLVLVEDDADRRPGGAPAGASR